MSIDCRERTEAYFRNMSIYQGDVIIRVRFLDKIFKAATDISYTWNEKIGVLKRLLEETSKEKDLSCKIVNLCFCYKLNNILKANLNIPVLKSERKITADICFNGEIPNKVKEKLEENSNTITFKLAETKRPDEECLRLYNVEIPKDHFFYNK